MGIIAWLIFGSLAGWVASMIAGTNERQGCLLNIVVGVIGSFIGGFLYSFFTGAQFIAEFNIGSFVVAVIGAVIFLMAMSFLRGGSRA
jgi:uncharacterized membrane protein YeaQ/YmgE (transglycosylase-associated protein family)